MSEHELDRAAQTPDLMAALRASIERFKAGRQTPTPSLADAMAQIEPFKTHHAYGQAVNAIEVAYFTVSPWEAAAKATELAELFEEVFLRNYYTPSVEFDCS